MSFPFWIWKFLDGPSNDRPAAKSWEPFAGKNCWALSGTSVHDPGRFGYELAPRRSPTLKLSRVHESWYAASAEKTDLHEGR